MQPQPPDPQALVAPENTALAPRRPDDWQALGEAFEAMGKAGLALTIGFTVAATVCKLAQQGKLKLPDLTGMLGIPAQPITLDLAEDIIFKGAKVEGISGREMFGTWYKTLAFFKSRKVDITPIITHRMGLSEFPKVMELLQSGNCGKVVMFPE